MLFDIRLEREEAIRSLFMKAKGKDKELEKMLCRVADPFAFFYICPAPLSCSFNPYLA